MKTYLYRIDNIETKEFYLGVRSCKCEIANDPYMGSSSQWNKEYIRVNREILTKTIIEEFAERGDANKAESDLIELHILDPLCVNRYIPKYYKEFMRRTASEETKKLQSINNSGENNPFFGKHHTTETKEILVKVRKERVTKGSTRELLSLAGSGEKNPFYGKHHTEEVKKSLSQQRKEKYIGEGNPFFGRKHTAETKLKMSQNMSGENSGKARAVIITTLETLEEQTFISITEMCKVLNFPPSGIAKAIKANRNYLKKYSIKYVEK